MNLIIYMEILFVMLLIFKSYISILITIKYEYNLKEIFVFEIYTPIEVFVQTIKKIFVFNFLY